MDGMALWMDGLAAHKDCQQYHLKAYQEMQYVYVVHTTQTRRGEPKECGVGVDGLL
jgi:hypothetical protein